MHKTAVPISGSVAISALSYGPSVWSDGHTLERTIGGLYGGWTSLFSILSQSMRLKKAWSLTSRSPDVPQPNRFIGFFVNSCNQCVRK